MDLLRIFCQKKIKDYFLLFCTCIFVAIAYEGTSLSAGLSQEHLEQVNDRLNHLEKKVEDIDECYVRVQDVQKDVEMIKRSMKESAAVKESEPVVSKRLETRLDKLEETVQDLSGRAALMDTAEEIRKVTEYVCPNGHGFETMSEDGKCRICGLNLKEREHFKKFKFARRESISERISTALEEEFKKRILVGASGTGIFQQILNDGEGRHSSAEGSLDLLFIGKPLTYMTFFVDLEAIGGNGPDKSIGSLSGLNDDSGSFQDNDGVDRVSVREAWLQTELLKQHVRLVIGKIDLTNYFDSNDVANDETTQFITSAFVNNRTLEVPENGPGIVSFYDTRKGVFFGLGLQSADNSGSDIVDGLYGIGEVGMRSRYLFGLEGTYRLWTKINGGRNNNMGLGINVDQHLSAKLVAFARYGINETDGADVKSAWSTGLDGNDEQVTEVYYKFAFNDHFAITPLFQAVFDPVGSEGSDVVTLAGIRTQIEF
ncbi:MAG TPA: carbohydrate porin [Candidatus Wunengus sp. YC63]|uniref:carbohydrate porin n=1 Tax=Candidatus Wunengus sp. YC63 TaxID=3367699 RepID=UPI004029CD21